MALDYGVLIAYILGIIVLFILGRMFSIPLKQVLKVLAKVLMGGVVIFGINIIGSFWGFKIALNVISAAVVGFLGLPGLILMVALKFLLSA
ncbi:pro-sigmaK processing inhibitor BofA family protein [Pseudoclostridium thermosuccinogenes]|jgi:inhibitor of the pro-sigma K processing machinery|uniref:pro-sigmaK processing inhibitor BofA family protein n=1 Tax=Clostridium thermosuccinogenes TaxID=84032 RepID=UPI002FDA62BC